MNENKIEVYNQLEHIKTMSGSAAASYYRLAMRENTWEKRVKFINLTIEALRAMIDELEGMAK